MHQTGQVILLKSRSFLHWQGLSGSECSAVIAGSCRQHSLGNQGFRGLPHSLLFFTSSFHFKFLEVLFAQFSYLQTPYL